MAIGLEQIAAVELLGLEVPVGQEVGAQSRSLGIMGEVEVSGDAGIAFLEPADGLVDLVGLDDPAPGDALGELVEIGAQAALLLGADGAILGDALLGAAEHPGVLIIGAGLDLDAALLLGRVARRGLAMDDGEA
jgi:hypothetical protein